MVRNSFRIYERSERDSLIPWRLVDELLGQIDAELGKQPPDEKEMAVLDCLLGLSNHSWLVAFNQ